MITDFVRASSIDEAVSLAGEGYVFLAGGTQVNNTPYRKWGRDVTKVVYLEPLGLSGIKRELDDVIIGALTTLQELSDSAEIPAALQNAAGFIPTRSVRNIATIGGNVGANRSDSYVIPALIALGATAELADGASVPVEDYVSKERDDLILSFRMPAMRPHMAVDVVKESRSHIALPVVSAAVRITGGGGKVTGGGGKVTGAVIAAGCVAPRVVRLTPVEQALVAGTVGDGPELEDAIARSISPKADILGSVAYKTYVNSAVIADAVRRCLREVQS